MKGVVVGMLVMEWIKLWIQVATRRLGSNQVLEANFCHKDWGALDMNNMAMEAMRTSGRSATLVATLRRIGWICPRITIEF